jgi:hypothetical protein
MIYKALIGVVLGLDSRGCRAPTRVERRRWAWYQDTRRVARKVLSINSSPWARSPCMSIIVRAQQSYYNVLKALITYPVNRVHDQRSKIDYYIIAPPLMGQWHAAMCRMGPGTSANDQRAAFALWLLSVQWRMPPYRQSVLASAWRLQTPSAPSSAWRLQTPLTPCKHNGISFT